MEEALRTGSLHSTAKIRHAQRCAAISATAEFSLCQLGPTHKTDLASLEKKEIRMRTCV